MGNIYNKPKKINDKNIPAIALKQIMTEMINDCEVCERKKLNGYLVQSVIEDKEIFICDFCSGTIRLSL